MNVFEAYSICELPTGEYVEFKANGTIYVRAIMHLFKVRDFGRVSSMGAEYVWFDGKKVDAYDLPNVRYFRK